MSGNFGTVRSICPVVSATPIFDELAAMYLAEMPDSRERLAAMAAGLPLPSIPLPSPPIPEPVPSSAP
ncbi:hypothetical protein GCM10022243_55770 [Saccharothrix violaceirubra]